MIFTETLKVTKIRRSDNSVISVHEVTVHYDTQAERKRLVMDAIDLKKDEACIPQSICLMRATPAKQ